ncbi:glutathione S-transferase family protein [Dongia sedimenti]|uniref:Glutathione S-transferase family protein n=1 Tax=Dongia sedimenti TaxID=3064282 RepID=A0ABU0YJT0_9PROT|nr:glutathione S-transferase family protein [Rhodospirillaceae bacterium R-7]
MLTVHHLGRSQSERIVWLCEELGIPYELKRYDRRADNKLAPPEYKALHPMGIAPVITDGDLTLGESGAIVEYIVQTYGNGRLIPRRGDAGFADFLYWFHFANATLQPTLGRVMALERLDPSEKNAPLQMAKDRLCLLFGMLEQKLGAAPYLAGAALTAADIMTVFSLTTMRLFRPTDLSAYPSILAYLQRVGARPGYQRAMAKADPGFAPLLGA